MADNDWLPDFATSRFDGYPGLWVDAERHADLLAEIERLREDAPMPRWPADHVKRPEPDHTRADLRVGRVWLAEQAELYVPARVLMERVQAMEADLARIPVGTLSKHRTARWTGRHWKEID
jgi:hypothetical protein